MTPPTYFQGVQTPYAHDLGPWPMEHGQS